MKPRVFLADLRYNFMGVLANDTAPLGVGYMKAVMDRDLPGQIDSRLFAYPDHLTTALKQSPPDILMLSDYCWNESLSLFFCKLAKQINPNVLTVMGGPNMVLEPERQIAFFDQHPELDVYILGEADFLARDIVRAYLEADRDRRRFDDQELFSCIRRTMDGQTIRNETWPRSKEVDEIPSPYLSGIMDEFFDGRLTPMIETNRGCPFSCTFCCQGTGWYTKVHYFSLERLHDEIHYIARKVKELCPSVGAFRIADSNYGMYERDIEISGYLGETQKLYNYPTYIDATTGKNKPDRIIKSLEQVGGALVLYQAVQSLDENVLRNVKRQTIKLEAYEQLQVHMRGRGLRSNSDLILGLPGETLDTHRSAIWKLLDSGINQVTNFQLMLLKGTELEKTESRNEFKFNSAWRVLPKNFGIYEGQKVFDVEEIVVETDTLCFDDYLAARKIALASSAFWHDNYFEDAIEFAEKLGVKRSAWLRASVESMDQESSEVRDFVSAFVDETRNELFATREECVAFYEKDENFDRLRTAQIGDNLMHKYRAVASFRQWPEICAYAMRITRNLILETPAGASIPDFDHFWTDFTRFVFLRHAHGSTSEEILSPATGEFHYDIAGWLEAGKPAEIASFRMPASSPVRFDLNDEAREELSSALQVWTNTLPGLTKMVTRIRVSCQVRQPSSVGEKPTFHPSTFRAQLPAM